MLFRGLKMFVHVNCNAKTVRGAFINTSVHAMTPSLVLTCASTFTWFADILKSRMLLRQLLILLIPLKIIFLITILFEYQIQN
nr:unnamed protein product [Callosobruchus analis]